jgi:hypothetical protein
MTVTPFVMEMDMTDVYIILLLSFCCVFPSSDVCPLLIVSDERDGENNTAEPCSGV